MLFATYKYAIRLVILRNFDSKNVSIQLEKLQIHCHKEKQNLTMLIFLIRVSPLSKPLSYFLNINECSFSLISSPLHGYFFGSHPWHNKISALFVALIDKVIFIQLDDGNMTLSLGVLFVVKIVLNSKRLLLKLNL